MAVEYIAVVNKDTKACGDIVCDEDAANRAIEKRRKHYPNDKDAEFVLVHGDAPCPAFADRE